MIQGGSMGGRPTQPLGTIGACRCMIVMRQYERPETTRETEPSGSDESR